MLSISGLLQFLAISSLAAAIRLPQETTSKQPLGTTQSNNYTECDYFQRKSETNPTFSGTPCESGQDLSEDGNCNSTQICGEERHCFIAWRNTSGNLEIVNSGCWIHAVGPGTQTCQPTVDCRAYNGSAVRGVFFCCCDGSFCSRKFHLDPPPTTTSTPQETYPVEENAAAVPLAALLGALIPVMIISIVIITFVYYRHRKHKYTDSEIDKESVNTPATSTTGCTVASFPANMETPNPHLLAVKARGRFGKVWRAQLEDRIVAVKTFNLSEKASWQNEQDIFCTPLMNTHPNILKFYTASSRGEGVHSELWLITEFYDQGSLADFLKVNKVNIDQALRIIETMACGMSFLHEDIQRPGHETKPAIAHRDFKSKNVLLDHNLNAVVADFGLAVKFLPGESPGESHGQVGTLRYMAPEVLEGAINFQKDAFLRIDMYAFGLVMWEIISRCFSFEDCGEYKMPFEEELGTTPTIDYMQEHVVEKKLRPHIKDEWKNNRDDISLCDTMEECWDHDAEARLSAGCVEQRLMGFRRNRRNDLVIQTPTRIINRQTPSSYTDTNAMNQLNIQMNILSKENVNQAQPGYGPADNNGSRAEDNTDKKQTTFNCQDDDHDSGTFANDDTLSHDGVTDQLLLNADSQHRTDDNDSATSLLTSENPIV